MNLKDFYQRRIFEFVKRYSPYLWEFFRKEGINNPSSYIRDLIGKHMDYNTIVVLWDGSQVIGSTTFNIKGTTAFITHCVVHPDYRGKDLLRRMTREAKLRYPYLDSLQFQRYLKYKSDKVHTIDMESFLKPAKVDLEGVYDGIKA